MAIHELLEALREDAAAQRAEVLSHAQDQASRIRAAATAAVTRRRNEFMAQIIRDAEAGERRTLARTRAQAMEGVLAARSRVLDRLREAVEERITAAREDGASTAFLAPELRAALDRMPPGRNVVLASPGFVAPFREAARALGVAVSVEAAPGIGTGFVLRSEDGGVELDATLETRLEHAWPRLAAALLAEVES